MAKITITAYQNGSVSLDAPTGNMPMVIDLMGVTLKMLAEEIYKAQTALNTARKAESPLIVDPNSPQGSSILAPGSKLRQ